MRSDRCHQARVVVAASDIVVATVDVANNPWARTVGLLGRTHLEPGSGMLLEPCHSIHTCFMRFPIDVLFLDREGQVLRAFDDVQPFRLASGTRKARATIELPAGARRRANIDVGTRLRIEHARIEHA